MGKLSLGVAVFAAKGRVATVEVICVRYVDSRSIVPCFMEVFFNRGLRRTYQGPPSEGVPPKQTELASISNIAAEVSSEAVR